MKNIKLQLTQIEIEALRTPLLVAHENAMLELRRGRLPGRADSTLIDWLQERVTALDKLREALS